MKILLFALTSLLATNALAQDKFQGYVCMGKGSQHTAFY